MSSAEHALRQRIFELLDRRMAAGNSTISWAELGAFPVDQGTRRLIAGGGKGIWNPQDLAATLSVVSSADGPYRDEEIAPGVWRYDYQKLSAAGDNTKLRRAMELRLPIVLLRRITTGVYVPHYPVYVTADNAAEHYFTLAVEDVVRLGDPQDVDGRAYVERIVRQRVHQKEFRGKVLLAYSDRCAVCRLRHPELLDAAHILPDRHERGVPTVPNGISLCKIHHSAYDQHFLGIDPDYVVHINAELLHEQDGPMLKHGIQAMHGGRLTLPSRHSHRPDRESLAERFERFRQAG